MLMRNMGTNTWMIPELAEAYMNGKPIGSRVASVGRMHMLYFDYPGKLKIVSRDREPQERYFEVKQIGKDYYEVWEYTTQLEILKERQNFELLATSL